MANEGTTPTPRAGGQILRFLRAKTFEEADAASLQTSVAGWLATLDEERLAAVVPLMAGTPAVLILYTD